jgi:hypothetical protein
MDNKDNNIQFTKINKNTYNLEFTIKNDFIYIPKIIDFSLIKLMFDLNKDIYEKSDLEIINEQNAIIYILLKHFFEDVGLNQKYSFLKITKSLEPNKIIFICNTVKQPTIRDAPHDAELININEISCICTIINPHNISVKLSATLDETVNVPPYVDKMISFILNKIIKRIKQFIENARL